MCLCVHVAKPTTQNPRRPLQSAQLGGSWCIHMPCNHHPSRSRTYHHPKGDARPTSCHSPLPLQPQDALFPPPPVSLALPLRDVSRMRVTRGRPSVSGSSSAPRPPGRGAAGARPLPPGDRTVNPLRGGAVRGCDGRRDVAQPDLSPACGPSGTGLQGDAGSLPELGTQAGGAALS